MIAVFTNVDTPSTLSSVFTKVDTFSTLSSIIRYEKHVCVSVCVCACIQLCTEDRSSKKNHCYFLASRAMSELYHLVVLCSYDLRFTQNALSSKKQR